MNALGNAIPVYLDQNILSQLREGKAAKEELVGLLRKLQEKSAVFVYSMTHVDECRASSQPEAFVKVMEELPIYFMDFQNASDQHADATLGSAREHLLEPEDTTHAAKRMLEGLLHVLHFAPGWLDETETKELRNEMAAENAVFWDTSRRDVDWDVLGPELGEKAKHAIALAEGEIAGIIKTLPFEQTRDEWQEGWARLRDRLPASFAQLDDVTDEQAVSYLFSCFEDREREVIESQFPQGFWSKLEMRETGQLAGLAFMLFLCGLVREPSVKKGVYDSRVKSFRGQFRDGVHIENAARCALFITCDKKAARLARSLYAYAGVETRVVELKIIDSPSQSPQPTK